MQSVKANTKLGTLVAIAIVAALSLSTSIYVKSARGMEAARPSSDFERDVALAETSIKQSADAEANQTEITNEDYKSGWDQSGINALVSGEEPMMEIKAALADDIDSQNEKKQQYAASESEYLQMTSSTPEEILQTEGPSQEESQSGLSVEENATSSENTNTAALGETSHEINSENVVTGEYPQIPPEESMATSSSTEEASSSLENSSTTEIAPITETAPMTDETIAPVENNTSDNPQP